MSEQEILDKIQRIENGVDRVSDNVRAILRQRDRLEAALREVEDYLDDRADVDDGIPNTAMRLLTIARAVLDELDGEKEGNNAKTRRTARPR